MTLSKAKYVTSNVWGSKGHELNHLEECFFIAHLSSVNQTLMTFHYTDRFTGILILAYYNPHIIG